jgi:hypothetical protein
MLFCISQQNLGAVTSPTDQALESVSIASGDEGWLWDGTQFSTIKKASGGKSARLTDSSKELKIQ